MTRARYQALTMAVQVLSLALVGGTSLFESLTGAMARAELPPAAAPSAVESAAEIHNCRFWGCISPCVPTSVIEDHLISLPCSIRNLGAGNPNGWSIAYACPAASEGIVRRGLPPAHLDELFRECRNVLLLP